MTAPTVTAPAHGAGVSLDGCSLTLPDVVRLARPPQGGPATPTTAVLGTEARAAAQASVALRDRLIADRKPVYGVTTGFGDSVTSQISPERAAHLQRNLIRYHLNGTGPDAPPDVVRATLLIRANALARGNSGIRPEVIDSLLAHLAADLLPASPNAAPSARAATSSRSATSPPCSSATATSTGASGSSPRPRHRRRPGSPPHPPGQGGPRPHQRHLLHRGVRRPRHPRRVHPRRRRRDRHRVRHRGPPRQRLPLRRVPPRRQAAPRPAGRRRTPAPSHRGLPTLHDVRGDPRRHRPPHR